MFKAIYKNIIPTKWHRLLMPLILLLKRRKEAKIIQLQIIKNAALAKQMKGKEKINVAFLVVFSAVWKLDELYKLLMEHEHFDPVIFICPYNAYQQEKMLGEMAHAYHELADKGYRVQSTYNAVDNTWLDIKQFFKPDIVFFTSPYNGITRKEYYITNYTDTLTCYVPYSCAVCSLQKSQYDQLIHNLLWRFFVETPINLEFSKKFSRSHGENAIVTGYPSLDVFLNRSYQPKDVWKIKDSTIKRIIWAPHHTIDNREHLNFSTFLIYHQVILDLAESFKDKIQIAFKPHPLLKIKLYEHKNWGQKKTDTYYNIWENLDNGQLELGAYTDLFYTSDWMIFDSISFIMEYLYLRKPGIFTMKSDKISGKLNKLGQSCLENYYHAYTKEDIIALIGQLSEGKDDLSKNREDFFENYLNPPNNKTASENILSELIKVTR